MDSLEEIIDCLLAITYHITTSPLSFTLTGLKNLYAAIAIFLAAYNANYSAGRDASGSTLLEQLTLPPSADVGVHMIANVDDPNAIDSQLVCLGYKASNIHNTSFGFTASLSLAGEPCNTYGTDVSLLTLSVEYQAADRLNIQIIPSNVDASNSSWYLLPENLVPRPEVSSSPSRAESDLVVSWSNEPSFSFKVTRAATGDVIFSTEGFVLVYEDQFIEFVSHLPENYNLYGLGEHIQQLRLLNNLTLTIYAADIGNPIDRNIYGSHPFYLETRYYEVKENGALRFVTNDSVDYSKEYRSFSHGVFMRNAHGQEINLRPQNLTWRTIGGAIDLTFYSGPSSAEVIQNYQVSTVGLPAIQKYSTLGYHQCRWGYNNWSEIESVVDSFEKFGIPLEYIWSDIDYMHSYRNFDNDESRYPYAEGRKFLERLHQSGRHYTVIVDAAIYMPNPKNLSDVYDTYTRGSADDIWLKNPDGSLYIGAVWPGYTVFTDWHNPKASQFWANELTIYHRKVPYDGVWIDMNEASSFCVGSCGSEIIPPNMFPSQPSFREDPERVVYDYTGSFNVTDTIVAFAVAVPPSSVLSVPGSTTPPSTSYLHTTPTPGARNINYPPYVINHVQEGHDLAVHAISPNATHIDGFQEYDVHNIYGYQTLNATYQALLEILPGKRPFIIGRSTFAGSGKWAGHWGGDNRSLWAHMFFSIPQALSFSLFGIPMFGADTCGFGGDTDEELCSRWMQLSAFFPFYRNHNTVSALPQEPYRWASVIEASKTVMKIRYSILPYFYTLFHLAHTTGSTVMRALAWEFPNDPSLAVVDTQFLVGPSIMVMPVLEPQADTVKGVFPGTANGEMWYDWYTQVALDAKPGLNITIPAPLGHIPVFVRGGSILPMQEPALTTRDARRTPWSLLIALSRYGTASGQLYLDDGESLEPEDTLHATFTASDSGVRAVAYGTWKEKNPLANVSVLGLSRAPSAVTFNGQSIPFPSIRYNGTSRVLTVSGLQRFTVGGAWDREWELRW